MMKKLSITLVMLVLASCASRVAETPEQRIFGIQADFNAPLAAAVVYETQPRCIEGQTALDACSDPEVVAIIRTAAVDARAAIQAAQEVVRTPGVAESKISLAIAVAKAAVDAFVKIAQTHNLI